MTNKTESVFVMPHPVDHNNDAVSEDSKENVEQRNEDVGDIIDACSAIREQSLSTLMKWTQAFGDSENFDNYFEKRVDELLKEAVTLEETLIKQKTLLRDRLKGLSKSLLTENEC